MQLILRKYKELYCTDLLFVNSMLKNTWNFKFDIL